MPVLAVFAVISSCTEVARETESAATVIPVPPTTFNVASSELKEEPVRPSHATIPVMSPIVPVNASSKENPPVAWS